MQQEPKSQCAESPIAEDREETNIAAIDLSLGVSGIVNRSLSLWSLGESVRPWQTILESVLWPISGNTYNAMQHCGAESPLAKDRGKNKNCSHRSLSLWSLGESVRYWQTSARVSCRASLATPNESRTMQCDETPVDKDQKLQPSISLLVVLRESMRSWQTIIERFLWSVNGTP